jgi:hypothetical protein
LVAVCAVRGAADANTAVRTALNVQHALRQSCNLMGDRPRCLPRNKESASVRPAWLSSHHPKPKRTMLGAPITTHLSTRRTWRRADEAIEWRHRGALDPAAKSQDALRLSAKRQSNRQPSIDAASKAPPKSSMSSSQNEVVSHINIRSPPLQPAKFVTEARFLGSGA